MRPSSRDSVPIVCARCDEPAIDATSLLTEGFVLLDGGVEGGPVGVGLGHNTDLYRMYKLVSNGVERALRVQQPFV